MNDDPSSWAKIEQTGPVAWLTLARPEKANALNSRMIERLAALLDEAEERQQARVLVIGGSGRNFCAGADLNELLDGGAGGLRILLERLRDFMARLERSHLITIAAVHGAARAGGLELALACDVIIAAKSATFGDAHVARNLLPGGGSSVRLPRCVGWSRAKWMILSGATIDAETARDWGLALEVVEDTSLRSATERVAQRFFRGDRGTIKRLKTLLAMVGEQPMSVSLEAEIASLEAHYHSDALRAGISDFLGRGPSET